MRCRATELVDDHLVAKNAPFTFTLKESGDEIRSAPYVYVKSLQDKVDFMLDQNERYCNTPPFFLNSVHLN